MVEDTEWREFVFPMSFAAGLSLSLQRAVTALPEGLQFTVRIVLATISLAGFATLMINVIELIKQCNPVRIINTNPIEAAYLIGSYTIQNIIEITLEGILIAIGYLTGYYATPAIKQTLTDTIKLFST